ncbi:response regulator [Parabacteroides sp.]
MRTINILIIDDSEIHIIGMKSILRKEPDMHILDEAHTIPEAIESLKKELPDIILLDISLEKETDGLDFASYIYQRYPAVNVIILSHYKNIHYIIQALRNHIRAYLAKDTKPEELIDIIRAVNRGKGVYFGESIAYKTLLDVFGGETNLASGKPYELTAREIEVIEYLAQGYSSKEISVLLQIDKNTVESHKERIKNKLGVNTVIEIVVFALSKQIIRI